MQRTEFLAAIGNSTTLPRSMNEISRMGRSSGTDWHSSFMSRLRQREEIGAYLDFYDPFMFRWPDLTLLIIWRHVVIQTSRLEIFAKGHGG